MKREAFIRDLRRYARKNGLRFTIDHAAGKGSHYRIRMGEAVTTIQSGELSPLLVQRICRQLQISLEDL